MGNLGYKKVKGSNNLDIALDILTVIITKSNKLLKLGNSGGLRPPRNYTYLTFLHVYT